MSTSTILVIEDDAAIRRGLVDALDYAGHKVLEAGDGPAGLAAALETAVDLVLLDVMLPGKDGFEVLRELRAAKPTLPVIMVTARGAERDVCHAREHVAKADAVVLLGLLGLLVSERVGRLGQRVRLVGLGHRRGPVELGVRHDVPLFAG